MMLTALVSPHTYTYTHIHTYIGAVRLLRESRWSGKHNREDTPREIWRLIDPRWLGSAKHHGGTTAATPLYSRVFNFVDLALRIGGDELGNFKLIRAACIWRPSASGGVVRALRWCIRFLSRILGRETRRLNWIWFSWTPVTIICFRIVWGTLKRNASIF